MLTNKFAAIQQLGRTLMLPIAVLPIAGLLLRLGQPDLLNMPFVAQAGDAVFSNLALLFAVGVAVGFAKDNNGVAGLAGAVGYFVLISAMKTIDRRSTWACWPA
jgi:PTS system N-acetylglucosamine-specific IIC component